jgi:cytochrome o ubiquinol oxidase subunit 3
MSSVAENTSKTMLGFWVYLMTDCVLFASLFATFAVLRGNTYGGPNGHELFSMPFVLSETLILLTSSFTCGLAILAARQQNRSATAAWLVVTFMLGASFLVLEVTEFRHLAHEGNNWQRSAFLSSFFTLVATHGLHITTGLLWMGVMLQQLFKRGLTSSVMRKLSLLSLFWHFLDIIWIFIFTVVYLLSGANL